MTANQCQFRHLLTSAGVLLSVLVTGCGGGGDGGGGVAANTRPGFLTASLTDAPACGYDEVNVTVSRVRIHRSSSAEPGDAGWTDIQLNPVRTINLLDLNDPTQPNFALERLGQVVSLPAGHYTQVRLVLVRNANSVRLSNGGALEPLDTPSAIQSGIKLVNEFDVAPDQHVDLLLDFDACKSIVRTGNGRFKLKPVIKVIPYVLNGIQGVIDPALFGNQLNVNNNVNHVTVSAQVNGEVIRATVPNSSVTPSPDRGRFFLARLTPGVNYDVVITADGRATKIISGVPVPTSTSTTDISDNLAPLTLAPSAVHTVSGTVTLDPPDDEGTVVVAAKQVLSGGPVVTVKTIVATMRDDTPAIVGDYSYGLTLPVARPWLGGYSSTLPIGFTEQPTIVGGAYTVHSSAQTDTMTYATQTPSPLAVNIGTQDAPNQNVVLRP